MRLYSNIHNGIIRGSARKRQPDPCRSAEVAARRRRLPMRPWISWAKGSKKAEASSEGACANRGSGWATSSGYVRCEKWTHEGLNADHKPHITLPPHTQITRCASRATSH